MGTASYTFIVMFVAGPMITFVSHKNDSDFRYIIYVYSDFIFYSRWCENYSRNHNSVTFGSIKACFVTAFEDCRQQFKESFPELDEIKCFIENQRQ
jgi:hypothetical protein